MQFQALSQYFVVKVAKHIQKDTREKEGYFYTHSDHVFMQREVQSGEIVSIGKEAQELFPTVQLGYTLIFHHFVTGREMEDDGENRNYLGCDDFYNYYTVTVKSHMGEKNLTYGIYDGETIIPHKQFVFLEVPKIEPEVKKENDLYVVDNFTESREELGDKMKEIKKQVGELVKTEVTKDITVEIEKKESEMNILSKRTNKRQILLYTVAYISDFIKSKFSIPFTKSGILNIACNTKVFFNGIEYIIADTKYMSSVA